MTMLVKNGVFCAPSGLKVKGQSYQKLEDAADTLRPKLPTMRGAPFKLDCISIFEVTLPSAGYNYRTIEVDEIDDCAAFTIPEENVVVLRDDVYAKLHANQVFGRSTVVHELSHLALGHHLTLHRGAVLGQHKFFEDSEWQAKALTAALMMPKEATLAAKSPRELAELCGTSVESATYRIKTLVRLGLLPANHSLWEYMPEQ